MTTSGPGGPTPTFGEQFSRLQLLQSGNAITRRPTLNVLGATLSDDPVAGVTTMMITGVAGGGQGPNLVLANGLNSNVATDGSQFQRINGPTGAYRIGGINPTVGAIGGQAVLFSDTTGQAFSIVNEDVSSSPANRIRTPNGKTYRVAPGSQNAFQLFYDKTIPRWVLTHNGAQQALVINVAEAGAIGDGATDSTAIQDAAMAFAGALGPNARVYFPGATGAYLRSGTPLAIPAGVEVFGDGPGATSLKQSTAGVDVVSITDVSDPNLHDMKLISSGGAHGAHIKATSNVDMEHPTLERLVVSGFGTAGLPVQSVSGNTVNATAHPFANGDAVMFSAGSHALFLVNPTFGATGNTVNIPAHGLVNGDPIQFNDDASGTLPSPLAPFTTYYVVGSSTNSFQASATHGGSALVFTGSGSPSTQVVIWPEVPGGLLPYLEYYVINAASGTFQVSATIGGAAVTLSGVQPASTCTVAKIFAGIFFESAGTNIYSPRVRDCRCNGPSTYWDGGARQGVRSQTTSGGNSIIHLSVIGGEMSNLRGGVIAPQGEVYVTNTHIYNILDGSGGGVCFYANASGGMNAKQIRFEASRISIERAAVFGPSANVCEVEGLRQFQSYQIVDLGNGSSWALGVNAGVINQQAGAWAFGFLYQDSIAEKTLGHGVAIGCATLKSSEADFSADVKLTGSAAFRSASGFFYNPSNSGLALALGNNAFTTFGVVTQNNNNVSNRVSDGASNVTTSAGSTTPTSYQLPSNSAVSVTFTAIARRTGGSRGTGAVGDSAMFVREALVKMVGANSGTPTIVGTTLTPVADQADTDLTTAAISVALTAAAGGLIGLVCSGAANLNLTWHVVYEVKPLNSFP